MSSSQSNPTPLAFFVGFILLIFSILTLPVHANSNSPYLQSLGKKSESVPKGQERTLESDPDHLNKVKVKVNQPQEVFLDQEDLPTTTPPIQDLIECVNQKDSDDPLPSVTCPYGCLYIWTKSQEDGTVTSSKGCATGDEVLEIGESCGKILDTETSPPRIIGYCVCQTDGCNANEEGQLVHALDAIEDPGQETSPDPPSKRPSGASDLGGGHILRILLGVAILALIF